MYIYICIYAHKTSRSRTRPRHDSSIPYSFVWHDSFVCLPWILHLCVTWLLHVWDTTSTHIVIPAGADTASAGPMAYLYVSHDSFTWVTWLVHVWDVSHITCATRLSCARLICDMSYVHDWYIIRAHIRDISDKMIWDMIRITCAMQTTDMWYVHDWYVIHPRCEKSHSGRPRTCRFPIFSIGR